MLSLLFLALCLAVAEKAAAPEEEENSYRQSRQCVRGERKCEEFVLGCVSSIIIQRSLTLILILILNLILARVTFHLRIANHLV